MCSHVDLGVFSGNTMRREPNPPCGFRSIAFTVVPSCRKKGSVVILKCALFGIQQNWCGDFSIGAQHMVPYLVWLKFTLSKCDSEIRNEKRLFLTGIIPERNTCCLKEALVCGDNWGLSFKRLYRKSNRLIPYLVYKGLHTCVDSQSPTAFSNSTSSRGTAVSFLRWLRRAWKGMRRSSCKIADK